MGMRNDGDAASGHGRQTTARGDAPTVAPTVAELLTASWSAGPDRPVLVDRRRVIAADELDDLTSSVAATLQHRGIGPGDRVLWQSRATLDSVVALLGIVRAGAAIVPLSTSATAREVRHVVADATPAAAVCESELTSGDVRTVWTVEGIVAEASPRTPVPSRASGPRAHRRRARRVHLGHDRGPQGGGPHPRILAGRRANRGRRPGSGSPTTA